MLAPKRSAPVHRRESFYGGDGKSLAQNAGRWLREEHEAMSPTPPGATAQWTSGYGFLLAALGAAVGLGNIWRFSYVAGENGGGAFIIVYVAAVLVLGWPLLIAELALGRSTRADAITAFARIAPARPWRWVGWIGVLACIAILSYYPVVAGWVANYLWRYLHGAAAPAGRGAEFSTALLRRNQKGTPARNPITARPASCAPLRACCGKRAMSLNSGAPGPNLNPRPPTS